MKFLIGPGLECDLEELKRGRMLVQGMSGSGKSWLLRRMMEQTFDEVQQFVLDSEGDFKTLREHLPYLLVAVDEGDIPARVETARALAQRLMELQVSAIFDISALPMDEEGGPRAEYVAEILRGMLDAPQRLWHDMLVILDEAQLFAPQSYHVASRRVVNQAAGLVRKRGLGLILATNRLSELHKTAAAHLTNKLVGRSMGIDADRAGRELGMRRKDVVQLQSLDDGEFYAFGPALSRELVKVKVGDVISHHPTAGGDRTTPAPPTPAQIKSILAELATIDAAQVDRADEGAGEKRSAGPCTVVEHGTLKTQLSAEQDRVRVLDRRLGEVEEANQALRDQLDAAEEDRETVRQLAGALARLPGAGANGHSPPVSFPFDVLDLDDLAERVAPRLPVIARPPVAVPPAEALRKDYLERAVARLTARVERLSDDARAVVRLLLGQEKYWNQTAIEKGAFGTRGSTTIKRVKAALGELVGVGVVRKGGQGRVQYKASVREAVQEELGPHGAKDDEVQAVVDQVLHRLVGDRVTA